MAKHPQVRQLVDHHGFEGFGGRENESPGEGETPLLGSAPPSAALVANADRDRFDAEADSVTSDLTFDLDSGARLEPRLEDGRDGSRIRCRQPHDDLVLLGAANSFDGRSSPTRVGRLDPQTVQLAAEADLRAIAKPSPRRERGQFTRVAVQVPSKPGLAFDQEGTNVPFRVHPAATARCRNSHDDASARMDHDAQTPRTGRATERVVERPAGELDDGGGLGDGHDRDGATPRREPVTCRPRVISPVATTVPAGPPSRCRPGSRGGH